MPLAEAGRFCDQCSKNVIDFSSYSEQAIIDYFVANNGKQICGRMRKSQIETIRIVIDQNLIECNIANWKKFLIVLLIIFGYELFGAEFTFAQTTQMDSIKQEKLSIIENDSLHYFPMEEDSNSIKPGVDMDSSSLLEESNVLEQKAIDSAISEIVAIDKRLKFELEDTLISLPFLDIGLTGWMIIEPTTPMDIIVPFAEFPSKSTPKRKAASGSSFINQSEHMTIDDKREVPKKENQDTNNLSYILPQKTRRKKYAANFNIQ